MLTLRSVSASMVLIGAAAASVWADPSAGRWIYGAEQARPFDPSALKLTSRFGLVDGVARWTGAEWERFVGAPTGWIYAVAELPDGSVVVGGSFTQAGGGPATNVAVFRGGAWRPLGAGLDGAVYALAVDAQGSIIAGGYFGRSGPRVVRKIAKWSGADWSPMGYGMNGGDVLALAVAPNGDIIAGGTFTIAGAYPTSCLARWDGTQWLPAQGEPLTGVISALVIEPSGAVIAAGSLSWSGLATPALVARLENTRWSRLGDLGEGDMFAIARAVLLEANGDIIVAGDFERASGDAASTVARWDGAAWTGVGALHDHLGSLAKLPDGRLVAGGRVFENGQWTFLTSGIQSFGLYSGIYSLTPRPQGGLYVGGRFDLAGRVPSRNFAAWDGLGWSGLGEGLGIDPDATVSNALVLPNKDVIAIGGFSASGAAPLANVARWNGAVWSPLGAGLQGGEPPAYGVTLRRLEDGSLVVGGRFASAGGAQARCLARWDGSSWSEFAGGITPYYYQGGVFGLTSLPTGELVAIGNYIAAGGVSARGVAMWDGIAWTPLVPEFDGELYCATVTQDGELVVGGFFTTIGGVQATSVAGWKNGVWRAMPGISDGYVFTLFDDPVHGLLAGCDARIDGAYWRQGLIAWNGSHWSPFDIGADPNVYAITRVQSELVIGGGFDLAGGRYVNHIARWSDTGIPWIARHPVPQATAVGGGAVFTAAPASGYDFAGPIVYQWRLNGAPLADGTTANGTVVSGSTTGSLTLASLSPLDAGAITCAIANTCGGVTTNAARLTVGRSACPGDADADGAVNFFDLSILLSAYGTTGGPGAPGASGDINGDGVVDFLDLAILLANYGRAC